MQKIGVKNKFMSVRIEEDIKEELKEIGKENERKLTEQVLYYVKQGLARDKKQKLAINKE